MRMMANASKRSRELYANHSQKQGCGRTANIHVQCTIYWLDSTTAQEASSVYDHHIQTCTACFLTDCEALGKLHTWNVRINLGGVHTHIRLS